MDNFSKAEISNRPKALAVIRSILKPEYEVVESPVGKNCVSGSTPTFDLYKRKQANLLIVNKKSSKD